jgi:hypothetical protein
MTEIRLSRPNIGHWFETSQRATAQIRAEMRKISCDRRSDARILVSKGSLTVAGSATLTRSPPWSPSSSMGRAAAAGACCASSGALNIKISVLGVVRVLEQCPELTQAFVAEGTRSSVVATDGSIISKSTRRPSVIISDSPFSGIKPLTGHAPWAAGRPSNNTRRLLAEHGGFLYDWDYLGGKLRFWVNLGKRSYLVIPTSFKTNKTNDNRFDRNSGSHGRRLRALPTISTSCTKRRPSSLR